MPILFVVALVLTVVAAVISYAFRPKQVPPYAAQLSDFTVPTADVGRPIPEVFGTVMLNGPNVVWYGDLTSKLVKYKV